VTQSASGDLAPSFVSMTPPAGTGLSQKFSVQLYAPNGSQQIDNLYLNLDRPASTARCDVSFSKFSGTWYGFLNGASTSVSLPGNDVSNAVCRLKRSDFNFTPNGVDSTLTFGIVFQPGYAGALTLGGS
jgi:hypothetical protein